MDTSSTSVEQIKVRRISTEDMIRLQLDRINFLRGQVENPDRVAAWSESLEALADLLLPLSEDDAQFQKEWEDRPVAMIDGPAGRVMVPTAQDCRHAQQILMRLMKRHGFLFRSRTISGPVERDFGEASEGVALEM